MLQYVAVCCSVSQRVAVFYNMLQCDTECGSALHCVVLQCVAVCCNSVLQSACVVRTLSTHTHTLSLSQSVAEDGYRDVIRVQCVLQCVAACCSVLQRVLQCVAVCECAPHAHIHALSQSHRMDTGT